MNLVINPADKNSDSVELKKVSYDRNNCLPGIIHIGIGAFHRAHQAAYINQLLALESHQRWGIVGVNLRSQESHLLQQLAEQDYLYTLKTMSADGQVSYEQIGSILAAYDWATDAEMASNIAADKNIHVITMTVTESGYYLSEDGQLNINSPSVNEGLQGAGSCIYTYLRAALNARREAGSGHITLLCCDNLRDNGHVLKSGLTQFLRACDDLLLLEWIDKYVSFPCSMVDRITPRMERKHSLDVQERFAINDQLTVMSEPFIQWVIEDSFAGDTPPLDLVGAEFVNNVEPYEDAKIRILNAGHTILTYMAALKGYTTFDQGMNDPELRSLFSGFEYNEAIPAIDNSPIDLKQYCQIIEARFTNANIADAVSRICADGVSKFPVFVLVTLENAYKKGIIPENTIKGIASWYVFMRHVNAGKIPFEYLEPQWDFIQPFLQPGDERAFATHQKLWGRVPDEYSDFVNRLLDNIKELDNYFPI